MNAIYRNVLIVMAALCTVSAVATKFVTARMLGIHVAISSKSYWDGPTKSCLPREKGGCCHIWAETMPSGTGEISGEMVVNRRDAIQFTVTRGKGLNNEALKKYVTDGKFILDGPLTFEPAVLSGLGLDKGLVIPPGTYPVTAGGDILVITFQLSSGGQISL